MTSNASVCVVCECTKAPYRCPKCRARYCSAGCCQEHKARGCANEGISNALDSGSPSGTVPNRFSEQNPTPVVNESLQPTGSKAFPTVDHHNILLSDDQKSRIRANDYLRTSMLSKRLREDFAVVDTAPNRVEALKKLRLKNPEFNSLVERVLSVVNGLGDK